MLGLGALGLGGGERVSRGAWGGQGIALEVTENGAPLVFSNDAGRRDNGLGAMVFLMPGEKAAEAAKKAPGSLTPREIVGELDKFIIGQKRAKKAVAVALRNRWRRQQLDPEMAREIL